MAIKQNGNYYFVKNRYLKKLKNLEYNEEVVKKQKEKLKNIEDLGGSDSYEDQQLDEGILGFFSKDKHVYTSQSEDEEKYVINKSLKNIQYWSKSKRNNHVLKLWRGAFNRAHGLAVMIGQINSI